MDQTRTGWQMPVRRIVLAGTIAALTAVLVGISLRPHDAPASGSPKTGVTAITAGQDFNCAVTASTGLKCWGYNGSGQIGNDSYGFYVTGPVDVSGLSSSVSTADAGWNFTCAVVSGGAKCWGNNGSGQIGDGTNNEAHMPVDVVGLSSGVADISAGVSHSCALMDTGSVKCWGGNEYGELGDGSLLARSTPVDAWGVENATEVEAGAGHTCAIVAGGAVNCWGYNYFGQLGDGTNTSRRTAEDVTALGSSAVAIGAGEYYTCALTTIGGVKCWGRNTFGQLGDGTTIDRTVPVNVTGLASGVTAISVGTYHVCALMTAGTLKCWGSNYYGQLGDGTTTDRSTPVNASGFGSGIVAVAAGRNHTCALTLTGGVSCVGDNYEGQLGNGTRTSSIAPVNVIAGPKPTPTATPCPPGGCPTATFTKTPTITTTPCPAGKVPAYPYDGACGTPTWTPTSNRPVPQVEIDKTVNGQQGPIMVMPGDSVTYRWVVSSVGGDGGFFAEVNDDTHDALDHSCSVPAGGTCEFSATVVLRTPGPVTNAAYVLAHNISEYGGDVDDVTVYVATPTPIPDSDGDGCSDAQEDGPNASQGGQRDRLNFWDYADMPLLGHVPLRDKKIRIDDILAVIQHYFVDDAGGGASINRNSDPLSIPPATGYHPAFDRGAVTGPHPWNVAPPDGQITVADILFVLNQYFHDCG